jgi:pilus assembly protein CpaB
MPPHPARSSPLTLDLPAGGRRRRSLPGARWRLLLWRSRFPVAAALLGVATALVVAELGPAPTPTVPVVVAGHALAAGVTLSEDDLRVVRMPVVLVPGGSHPRTGDLLGRPLVTGAPAGLVIVDGLLGGARLAGAGPPGTVVAPVRLADPAVAALLRPGDRIDLLAAAGTADGEPAARRLAERALVLAEPGPGPGAGQPPARQPTGTAVGGLLGGAPEPATGALTLVAVTPAEAAALAGSVGWSSLTAVVVK